MSLSSIHPRRDMNAISCNDTKSLHTSTNPKQCEESKFLLGLLCTNVQNLLFVIGTLLYAGFSDFKQASEIGIVTKDNFLLLFGLVWWLLS